MRKLFIALIATTFALSLASSISYAAPGDNVDDKEKRPRQSQASRQRSDATPKRHTTQSKPSTQRPATTQRPSTSIANNPAQQPQGGQPASRPTRKPAPAGVKATPRPSTDPNAGSAVQRPASKPAAPANTTAAQRPANYNHATVTARPTHSNTTHVTRPATGNIVRPNTSHTGRPIPRPTHNQQANYRPANIVHHKPIIVNPPRISTNTRPSRYYVSRPGYVRRGNYIVHNNYIVVRPGFISYVFHPIVYYRPLPTYYNPYYYHRYHSYYHGYSDFYILGRLLLAFANAVERNNQQEEIARLRDDISYLQRKLDLQDEQLTTNNKEEFYALLDELGVSRDEVDNYDLDKDNLLYSGS